MPAGVKAKIPSLSPLSTLPDRMSLIGAKLLFRIFLMNNDLRWSRRSSRGNCQNKNLEKLDFKLRGVKGKTRAEVKKELNVFVHLYFSFCILISFFPSQLTLKKKIMKLTIKMGLMNITMTITLAMQMLLLFALNCDDDAGRKIKATITIRLQRAFLLY